jgi:O-antigen ligase
LVLLGFGIGWRPLLRGAAAPLLGAVIAMTGLLPSITAHTPTTVTIVIAGVAAVIGVVVGSRVRATRLVLVVLVVVLAAALVLLSGRLAERFSLDSPDRWGSFRAAWDVFLRHPVTGVGPGIDQLVLARAAGGASLFRYAHNEYLQVLAELGIIGGLLLVAFLALLMRRLWRDRVDAGALGVGGLAALTALALHAGFDFVWHIPAVPLLAAAFVGVAMPQPQ